MDKKDILKKVDHTLLGQTATWDDIRGILDDIKTSTGFSTAGATFADVELMKKYIGKDVKVKAAGGISSFDDAEKFISLGAERLGTSRLIKILKNTDTGAGYLHCERGLSKTGLYINYELTTSNRICKSIISHFSTSCG